MTAQIDLNCDIGEGFGRWRMPYDAELMELVTTVNVAAGFHAGDPTIIRATVDKAVSEGVDIGVHVALPDLLGFGRRTMSVTPAEVHDYCTYQIGAVAGFVTAAGGILTHVKPHGALYAMASQNPEVASAIARSIREYDPSLRLFLLNQRSAQAVSEEGVTLVTEGFPELHYDDEGQLILERDKTPWDPATVARRAVEMAQGAGVASQSGTHLDLDVRTICVHSDGPNVLQITRELLAALDLAGLEATALSRHRDG